MTVTRAEIIERSARQMSVVGAGQNVAPADASIIGTVYDGLHERMLQNNELYWGGSDCVPIEAAGLMVSILSGTVLTEDSDFGLGDDEIQKITLMQDKAEGLLRELRQEQPDGQNVKANYF